MSEENENEFAGAFGQLTPIGGGDLIPLSKIKIIDRSAGSNMRYLASTSQRVIFIQCR